MSDSLDLEAEIEKLIIDSLKIEDLTVAEIESDAPLVLEGPELDSIDALDLAMALEQRFDLQIGDHSDAKRE